MAPQFTRRQFLQTSAAAAGSFVAGCSENPKTPAEVAKHYQANTKTSDPKNLYNLLEGTKFMGQNGEDVSLSSLKTSQQNKFTTLTFGLANCTKYCPMINERLAAVGKSNPDITSIIISVNPETDGNTQADRDAFLAQVRAEGVKQNVVVLYPKEGGRLSNNVAPTLGQRSGAIVDMSKPFDHSANVILYAPGGAQLDKKSGITGTKSFPEDWTPIIQGQSLKTP